MATMQPVDDIQLNQLRIEWVPVETVKPNSYNPNRMTWHDRTLLRQSILEDGWTQPIVTLPDGTIVDGEQRWTVASSELQPDDVYEILSKMLNRKAEGHLVSDSVISRLERSYQRLVEAIENGAPPILASITAGMVPVTRIDLGDDAHKMISTIRHNRARGVHRQDAMATITQDLLTLGLDLDDLEVRLGMDDEEINRFIQAAEGQLGSLEQELAEIPVSAAKEVVHMAEAALRSHDPSAYEAYEKSVAATAAEAAYHRQRAEHEQKVQEEYERRLSEQQAEAARALTQEEKDKIRDSAADAVEPPPEPIRLPDLVKLTIFVTEDEHAQLRERLNRELGPWFLAAVHWMLNDAEALNVLRPYKA